jgi:hypothetical protein
MMIYDPYTRSKKPSSAPRGLSQETGGAGSDPINTVLIFVVMGILIGLGLLYASARWEPANLYSRAPTATSAN